MNNPWDTSCLEGKSFILYFIYTFIEESWAYNIILVSGRQDSNSIIQKYDYFINYIFCAA